MKLDVVERTRQLAAQARSAADARGTTKPDPTAVKSGDPPPQVARDWWTVYRWGESAYDVLMLPARTQREMRALYPDAGGIIARET